MTQTKLKWKIPQKVKGKRLKVKGLPEWFIGLLVNRGLVDEEDIYTYLEPDYSKIVSPESFLNMELAVERVRRVKEAGERVVVYGDYDVDGITSTAIIFETLNKIGVQMVENYIPHREEEGYGLNKEALAEIKSGGATLVIAVDCGITAGELIDSQKGLDIIVIDHHTIDPAKLSKKAINLHPAFKASARTVLAEGDNFSAAGMAFIFALALQKAFPKEFMPGQEKWLLDLVALSTICDIVPLTGQNRLLASFGLKVLNKTKREGLRALMDVSSVESGSADAYSVGFLLGPRLNAAGRLESAQKALELLLSQDKKESRALALELNKMNMDRQLLCERIVEEARVKAEKGDKDAPIQLLSDKNWPRGVVGIVASRISDYYNRPAIIFEDDGELHHGSARSIDGVNIVDLLSETSDYLVKFGGHAKAAGLTVSHEHFLVFQEKLVALVGEKLKEIDLARELLIDTVIEPSEIDDRAMELIAKMEPTGYGNKRPIFMSQEVEITDIMRVGKNKEHLKFKIRRPLTIDQRPPLEAVMFSEPREPKAGIKYDVVFTLKYNVWNNRKNIEARVIDFREAE